MDIMRVMKPQPSRVSLFLIQPNRPTMEREQREGAEGRRERERKQEREKERRRESESNQGNTKGVPQTERDREPKTEIKT